jgi:hypothetical protein
VLVVGGACGAVSTGDRRSDYHLFPRTHLVGARPDRNDQTGHLVPHQLGQGDSMVHRPVDHMEVGATDTYI